MLKGIEYIEKASWSWIYRMQLGGKKKCLQMILLSLSLFLSLSFSSSLSLSIYIYILTLLCLSLSLLCLSLSLFSFSFVRRSSFYSYTYTHSIYRKKENLFHAETKYTPHFRPDTIFWLSSPSNLRYIYIYIHTDSNYITAFYWFERNVT